jgi:hypothetical protein
MPCFAAGSFFKVTGDEIRINKFTRQAAFRVLTLSFQADSATGAIPSLSLDATAWTDGTNTGDYDFGAITGWYGYNVEIDCNHAGTEPTENSELYIYQNGIDILGGIGVDLVDNTSEREVFFYFASTKETRPIAYALTVTVTQQAAATNSATGTIRLYLVP